jgi:hypothetical protein
MAEKRIPASPTVWQVFGKDVVYEPEKSYWFGVAPAGGGPKGKVVRRKQYGEAGEWFYLIEKEA